MQFNVCIETEHKIARVQPWDPPIVFFYVRQAASESFI